MHFCMKMSTQDNVRIESICAKEEHFNVAEDSPFYIRFKTNKHSVTYNCLIHFMRFQENLFHSARHVCPNVSTKTDYHLSPADDCHLSQIYPAEDEEPRASVALGSFAVNGTDNIAGGLLPVEETCSHYTSEAFHIKCLIGMYGVI